MPVQEHITGWEHLEDIPLDVNLDDAEERRCAELLIETLQSHPGVHALQWDPDRRVVTLRYDPRAISLETIRGVAEDLGLCLKRQHKHCVVHVDPARCRDCTSILEEKLAELPGIVNVEANVPGGAVLVEYEPDSPVSVEVVEEVIEREGFRVWRRAREQWERAGAWLRLWWRNRDLVLATFSLIFLVAGLVVQHATPWPANVAVVLYALSYLAGGYEGARSALAALRHGVLDIDFLMIVAALGAAYLGEWAEGAILLFLFSLSGALETFAMDRTRHAIEKLMELRPKTATVRRNGEEVEVPVEEVEVGEEVIVRPGEAIPVDGRVIDGVSAVDQSPITGESVPVTKREGDMVFAGSINAEGSLVVKVTKRAEDSTLARIIQLVEEAQSERAPMQRFIDRFSQPYATTVVLGSLAYLGLSLWLGNRSFADAFYRAMTLLVVASPCALVISTPASILAAIAAGARNGILFKGGAHLESLGRVRIIAFDKTGTLTYGKPQVTDVIPAPGYTEDDVLRLAAAVERRSEHPLARSIVAYAQKRGLEVEEPEDFRALVGKGVRGRVNGEHVYIGNDRLMQDLGRTVPAHLEEKAHRLRDEGKTVMWVTNSEVVGLLAVADVPRVQAAATVRELRQAGVERIVMLTGDHEDVARAIARRVGVDEVHADLLPEDKVRLIKELEAQGPTAMVGDGINDAPAMALASVGIAMGAAGTDVALETADVVLMADDLSKLPFALRLSKQARRIVYQNLVISVGVMASLILATLTVGIPLPLGVVGHEGSTLVVVLNGLRMLGFRAGEKKPMQRGRRVEAWA